MSIQSVMTRVILTILLCSILLCSCSGGGEEESSERSQADSALSAEEAQSANAPADTSLPAAEETGLRLAILQPASLLPWQVTQEDTADMLMLVYSPLVNLADNGTLTPCLAQSWLWSSDLSELTVTLRQDVTFHDGQALTASDVVYTIQQLKATENIYSQQVSAISSAQVLDTYTVLLRFTQPGRQNEECLVFPIAAAGYEEALVPMGTGPYAYQSLETRRELHLTRYDGYFGQAPAFNEVTVYFVSNEETISQCLEATRTNLMRMEESSWGTYVNARNVTLHRFNSYEALYLEFHTASGFSSVLSNRQKVAYALDAVRIMRDAYWGEGQITETLFRPGSWYQPEASKQYGYDVKKASDMAVSGQAQVRLLYDAQDSIQSAAAETIQRQLEEAGLSVTLTTSGEYDIALRRQTITLAQAAQYAGGMAQLSSAASDQEVMDAVQQMATQMLEELPVYTLFFLNKAVITGYGLQGELSPGEWNAFCGIETLYQEEGGLS